MKKLHAIATGVLIAATATFAGWIPQPLEISVPVTNTAISVATTGTITSVAAPAVGAAYYLSGITCGAVLPSATTNTVTVRVITAGPVTNSYAFTNGAAAASSGLWVLPSTTVTVTRAAGVTNLPTLTLQTLPSPVTVTRTLLPHERFRLWGVRQGTPIYPAAVTVAVSYAYAYGGTASPSVTLTNGVPASLLSSYVSLWPGDTITLVATQVTNSPVIYFPAERFYLQDPVNF